jgi:hypothetical protein
MASPYNSSSPKAQRSSTKTSPLDRAHGSANQRDDPTPRWSLETLQAAARTYCRARFPQRPSEKVSELLSDAVLAFVKSNPRHPLAEEFCNEGHIKWSEVDRWLRLGGDVAELLPLPIAPPLAPTLDDIKFG